MLPSRSCRRIGTCFAALDIVDDERRLRIGPGQDAGGKVAQQRRIELLQESSVAAVRSGETHASRRVIDDTDPGASESAHDDRQPARLLHKFQVIAHTHNDRVDAGEQRVNAVEALDALGVELAPGDVESDAFHLAALPSEPRTPGRAPQANGWIRRAR
jgi:hypothetical protein